MRTTTSAAAGLVLLAGLLTGCGGGGEGGGEAGATPEDATQEEFCEAYAGLFERMAQMDPNEADTGAGIEALQDWAGSMEDVGTPEDIPEDARQGFEVVLDSVREIDPDASEEELRKLGQDFSQGEQDSGEAFISYANKTCPDAMKGLLGDLESQMGDLEDELGNLEDGVESPAG